MMRRFCDRSATSRWIAAALTMAVAGLLAATVLTGCVSTGDAEATPVSAFSDYASWTRVNAEPLTGDTTGSIRLAHEGRKGIREVFINDIGKPVSFGKADYPYPTGTIIVKESYKRARSGGKGRLSSITVMVKRAAGYDPDHGDWEYVNVRPNLHVRAQGRIGLCISCHGAAVLDDYVFTNHRQ